MIINTNQHISDDASSVTFDKTKTIWKNDPMVNNLQNVFDDMHQFSVNGYPRATTKSFGIIILADDEDMKNNGNNSIMTNNFLLKSMDRPYATTRDYGTIRLSTESEYDSNNDNKAMTTKLLHYSKNKEIATTATYGSIKLATDKEVVSGTITNKGMSPNQLRIGINAIHKPTLSATESRLGTVRISSINDNYNGNIHNGFGVSPYSMMMMKASESKVGLVKYATTDDYNKNENLVAVSPNLIKGDVTNLLSTIKDIDAYVSDHEKFISSRQKIIKDVVDRLWGSFDADEYIDEFIPIGSFHYSLSLKNNTNFMRPEGQSLSKKTYPKLFSLIGYSFGKGSNDDIFKLPDTRGNFIKMYGRSKVIDEHKLSDFTKETTKMFQFQDDRMGGHKHAGWAGSAEYKWRNGTTTSRDWYGSAGGDYDNSTAYTNDGTNLGGDESLDPYGIIGDETRPWNMPMKLYMRIK